MMDFYRKDPEEIFSHLDSSTDGLSSEHAKRRLDKFGENTIQDSAKRSGIRIFFDQFRSFLVAILIVAAAIAFLMDEMTDAILIFIILILNAIFGFIQEWRAENSIAALKKLAVVNVKVLRDKEERLIDSKLLVPGDIIFLETGDKVPSDCRLLEGKPEMMEASLTGESTPVRKSSETLEKEAQIADRKDMLFAGTVMTKGRAKAVVVKTAMATELGKIAGMMGSSADRETPLQKKLGRLGRYLGVLVILICAIIFGVQIFLGGDILEVFMTAISLAVAAVPSGLPAVVTISLAIGVQRMVKKNALIRRLSSVETLGSTTVICTDKTGTLTHNEMTVMKAFVDDQVLSVSGSGYEEKGDFSDRTKSLNQLLKIGLNCNDAKISEGKVIGDPTEAALIVSARKGGMDRICKRIAEIPFDSERKIMSTVHDIEGQKFIFTKGAPEELLRRCSRVMTRGFVKEMTHEEKRKILQKNKAFAQDALRVLGFAYKQIPSWKLDADPEDEESNLVFVGLQAMLDPPREEARQAIERCRRAGIKVTMITGDQEHTALAIAHSLGMEGKAMSGEEIDKLDLEKEAERVAVFARVSPEHKMKIVKALQKKGHVVAMTGDGVNDAPALKNADIGVAMGVTGTDVSKEASDMVLLDDNFRTIVNAVEEGRGIFDNIRKSVNYLLSSNLSEVMVIFSASLMGMPVPLTAVQILWVNVITDGLPALGLGVDPYDKDLMKKPPRSPKERIINKKVAGSILSIGVVMSIGVLVMFSMYQGDLTKARTVAFTSLVALELVRVQMIRSEHKTPFFSNRFLLVAILISFALQLVVIYTPLNSVFELVPLGLIDWAYIGIMTGAVWLLSLLVSRSRRWFAKA